MNNGQDRNESMHVRCCIAGGGPAGMMLGFLLARAAIDVVVLEKHGDFLRDFRGDTIHPSTLELMHELGLLEDFLKRPHQEARELQAWVGDVKVTVADFSHLPTHCKFIALMPQWEFLDFIAQHAKSLPAFRLRMQAEVIDLITADGRIAGVRARTPEGLLEVRADLTVAADGRHSTVRDKAGLAVIDFGAPMDVLWTKLAKHPGDPQQAIGRFDAGRILVLIDRGGYWQCAFVIPKGGFDEIRRAGLAAFRTEVVRLAPFFADRIEDLDDWDDIKLLTVKVDRLPQWYRPGLLCIGDAAHAMSPIGGVGINLAIQDAVAAANILAAPTRGGVPAPDRLRAVQRRRELPTRLTQGLQVFVQNRIIRRALAGARTRSLPLPLRLFRDLPFLRRLPARLIGLGFRPEHVKTGELSAGSR